MSRERANPIYVFDGDGVLFAGTTDIFARVFAESLEKHGIPYNEAFQYMHTTTGQPIQRQYADILRLHGISEQDGDKIVSDLVQYFLDNSYVEIPDLCADAKPALELLQGRRMVISTNRPQDALTRAVERHGLNLYLTDWYGRGRDGITDKRYHNNLVVARFDVTNDEFRRIGLLIGDGPTDMKIAQEWGIRGIGRPTEEVSADSLTKAGAVAIVNDLKDLVELENQLFQ